MAHDAARFAGTASCATLSLDEGWSATVLSEVSSLGTAEVEFEGPGPLAELMETKGHVPLPPYIKRDTAPGPDSADRDRYQCVYAREPGAVAAPTAGLHFTPELLADLERAGVRVAPITLHVGEATFQTPRVGDPLPGERFVLPEQTSQAIAQTRREGGRVVAVGTTVTRTLESREPVSEGVPEPGEGRTDLVIAPGHRFRYLDGLMTNFHLPRTSLLMLVCAFGGTERVLAAYQVAIDRGYRFYSYGDAMLILENQR